MPSKKKKATKTMQVAKQKPKPAPKIAAKQKINTLIVGVGNMGASLARGLLASDLAPALDLRLFDHKPELLDEFLGTSTVELISELKNSDADHADVIIICTKPQDLTSVAKQIARKLKPSALLISILAAVTTDDLARTLDFEGAIVRAMPNIAATVGEAATALCKNDRCNDQQTELAHKIFTSFGTASWTKESLMDAVTGLSGSGPAYIYMVIESLTDGGVKMGMPRPLALELATQTVLGSAQLVQTTGLHPAILRDQVTTPGGTTIAAIHELEERGLRAMLISAVATATERSKELRANWLT
jgi:pyrroline-5-carboxylate reductase